MELQSILDIAFALIAALFGVLLKSLNQQLADRKAETAEMRQALNDWKMKVAEEYVRHCDFVATKTETLEHLRRIEDKLDRLIEKR